MIAIRFSVILPVCHGGRFLNNALKAIANQAYPANDFEAIVVAAQGDEEASKAVKVIAAKSSVRFRLLQNDGPTRSAMLNQACRSARGEWLLFTDDDCIPPEDWITQYRKIIDHSESDLIGGLDQLLPGGSAFDEALDWIFHSFVGTGGLRIPRQLDKFCPKLWNMAARRESLRVLAVNGGVFDETLPVHEDVELACRIRKAGMKVAFAPSVCVSHCRDTTFFSCMKRNFGMAQTCRREGIHTGTHLALAGGLFAVLAMAALSSIVAEVRLVLGLVVGLYLLTLLLSGVAAAITRRRLALLALAPVLIGGLHAARAAGFIWTAKNLKD